jgi:hypothetical protein
LENQEGVAGLSVFNAWGFSVYAGDSGDRDCALGRLDCGGSPPFFKRIP